MSDEANALERLRAWRTRAEQRWEITHDWAGYSLDLDERDRDGCIWRSVSVAGDGGGIETEKNIVLGLGRSALREVASTSACRSGQRPYP